MARIAGVDLPRNKRIEVALTYIYGIGHTTAKSIVKISRLDPDLRVEKLTDEQVASLRNVIDQNYKVEGALRTENNNTWRDIHISLYCGLVAAGATTVRTFLLPRPYMSVTNAGEVGDFDYGQYTVNAMASAAYTATITPSEAFTRTMQGVPFPIVWVRFAVKGNQNIYVYSIRVKEDGI